MIVLGGMATVVVVISVVVLGYKILRFFWGYLQGNGSVCDGCPIEQCSMRHYASQNHLYTCRRRQRYEEDTNRCAPRGSM